MTKSQVKKKAEQNNFKKIAYSQPNNPNPNPNPNPNSTLITDGPETKGDWT